MKKCTFPGTIKNQFGIAFVEFAIGAALVFFPIFFLLDTSYFLYKQGRAVDLATREARRGSVMIGQQWSYLSAGEKTCSALAQSIKSHVDQNAIPNLGGESLATSEVTVAQALPFGWGRVTVNITLKQPCLFHMFCGSNRQWTIRASAPFEKGFTC